MARGNGLPALWAGILWNVGEWIARPLGGHFMECGEILPALWAGVFKRCGGMRNDSPHNTQTSLLNPLSNNGEGEK